MKFLRGFGSFWYQLVIGDDWRVAAGVGVALVLGALAAANDVVSGSVLAVAVAALIVVSFIANLIHSSRSGRS